jgi:hypothetical protein
MAEFIQGTIPKGLFAEKKINIAYQNIIISAINLIHF